MDNNNTIEGAMSTQQQQPNPNALSLQNSSHPFACVFHVLFKAGALFLYLFGGFFSHDSNGKLNGPKFIIVSVLSILLLAADFWVVKNITGRLLVGLRWWNQVDGDNTRWIFESKGIEGSSNKVDSTIFWAVLYATPVIWSVLLFWATIKLNFRWLLIVGTALSLSLANVYGYYKCSSDQKAKFEEMTQEYAQRGVMTAMRSNLFGMLLGAATGTNNNSSNTNQQAATTSLGASV
eukprot:CAMPEP_0194210886 /NCGR_PEP_ID=MMETSP0156-20130528/9167_1 /TAXON_ID=33649 /ORGANISM="Thalassionema nitzschioides, Strain L26-B" /LENGTH=234 /DNA_ID=CAMNT_0038938297 /DNA_START=7 /DNA_END=708 /DNA_ORIENTATION=-